MMAFVAGDGELKAVERPVPQPAKDEVLIKVAAAGVNRPDVLQRHGLYQPPAGAPDILGLEVAGEVVAVSKGADELLSPQAKKLFQEAYPEDALDKLWNRPPEPSWFAELRTQYAEKFKAA